MAKTVTVNVVLATDVAQSQGFSTPAILTSSTAFANRSKAYTSMADVVADFANTTKEYKSANATFSQNPTVKTIKFIRKDAGDANITEALDNIFLEDKDWYNLLNLSRAKADILEVAAWAETNRRQYEALTEDADCYDSAVTTDVISSLAALNYEYTNITWHHNGGVDSATGSITLIASEVVTVTDTAHGLRVGDSLTVSNGLDPATNGNFTVATVPTADTFTYVAVGAVDTAIADPIDYFARYDFFEAGLMGAIAWKEVGADTRKFVTVKGQVATPTTLVNSGQIQTILNKGGNVYIEEKGLTFYMDGTNAKGGFADNRLGADWLEDTMYTQILTTLKNAGGVPYNDAGFGIVENEIRDVMAQALARNVRSAYSETQDYILNMPRAFQATDEQKEARTIPPITITTKIGGFVHYVTVNVTMNL